ncbi:conserved hypothetical protein [Psychromonas ingrahamii 37]|uniref:DUF4426 domain-containing protein n=1 Tax=Psychromonas ingrahamii (strain DSM 17664 / CCUG 51855 / 37) TaxID=357804 RepID=A1SZ31_PSYIN|nr:DUF4426 domain-containing protein [Psychromonas ingrahamii]ABM04746.1 conserved hypothetical protein [Psychromonas ingrahamii 37]
MLKIKQYYQVLFIASLFCFSQTGMAAQFQDFDNLEVHYIALPSTFLQPDIAKKYNIKRSQYNGLINISVLDKRNNNKSLSASLSGSGKNLLGQSEALKFQEIKEGDSIYYIADYPFLNEEIVNFNIIIKTSNKTNVLKFQHKFYIE